MSSPRRRVCAAARSGLSPASLSALLESHRQRCPELTDILVSGNLFGVEGARVVAEFIASPRSVVQRVDLSCNDIGPEGFAHITSSLSIVSTLRRLDVSYNLLRDTGARIVGCLLRADACALKELDVRDNQVSFTGLVHIAVALPHNHTLQRLLIGEHSWKVSSREEALLVRAAASNDTLLDLINTWGNPYVAAELYMERNAFYGPLSVLIPVIEKETGLYEVLVRLVLGYLGYAPPRLRYQDDDDDGDDGNDRGDDDAQQRPSATADRTF